MLPNGAHVTRFAVAKNPEFTINRPFVIVRAASSPDRAGPIAPSRTHLTTRSELQKRIASAKRAGTFAAHFWFVEVKIPGRELGKKYPVIIAAPDLGGAVPVIPVGYNPEVSEGAASILVAWFEETNQGSGCEFALSLGNAVSLAPYRIYEWLKPLDAICALCGAVFTSTFPADLCDDCCRHRPPEPEPDRYHAQWRMVVRLTAATLAQRGVRPPASTN